ncbi:hypothetical protein SLEP1_g43808 [Rubroshorea leprosula]|uniref:Uncharacterized protein n=1 Tax=Rubroshorea leprosula TaxID=152421 RepID=A0AAV5LE67_9ROSI|nr:hypothetical protein SLEP1_g43808 [Rubroshorea leprosula]
MNHKDLWLLLDVTIKHSICCTRIWQGQPIQKFWCLVNAVACLLIFLADSSNGL